MVKGKLFDSFESESFFTMDINTVLTEMIKPIFAIRLSPSLPSCLRAKRAPTLLHSQRVGMDFSIDGAKAETYSLKKK